jgi:molybdopterin-containing oxidoreductase family iron-sulfur binding subunit
MMVCPYFARHFNWKKPVVPKKEINPAVPVRPRGVVEKCLFCIHRTRRGKVTACVEACPVQARKFGDINNPQSVVAKIVKTRRTYRIKEELGTEPSIYYVW